MSNSDPSNEPRSALEELAAATQQPSRPTVRPATSGAHGGQTAYNRTHRPGPQGGYGLSVLGASLGAAVGALLWIGIGWVTNMEIGYVAIGVGALAGWGAVTLGRRQDATVGIIAALAGAVGIIGGSYGNFAISLHSADVRGEFQEAFEKEIASNPEQRQAFARLSAPEKEAVIDQIFEEEVLPNVTYLAALTEDPKSMLFLFLFGGMGLFYGFRVGSGGGKT